MGSSRSFEFPTMKLIPRCALGLFARIWAALLLRAIVTASPSDWFSALAFPRCVLVSLKRCGKRVSRGSTQVVLDRIHCWSENPRLVLAEAVSRPVSSFIPPTIASLEKTVLSSLRVNDVKKALQALTSAPFAP